MLVQYYVMCIDSIGIEYTILRLRYCLKLTSFFPSGLRNVYSHSVLRQLYIYIPRTLLLYLFGTLPYHSLVSQSRTESQLYSNGGIDNLNIAIYKYT